MRPSDLQALESCDRLLTLSRGEQVGSLARAAGWEPRQSRLGALPEQHVGSLGRGACWEPCHGSRLGALPGQQVGSLPGQQVKSLARVAG